MSSKLFLYIQNFSSDHKRYKEGGKRSKLYACVQKE